MGIVVVTHPNQIIFGGVSKIGIFFWLSSLASHKSDLRTWNPPIRWTPQWFIKPTMIWGFRHRTPKIPLGYHPKSLDHDLVNLWWRLGIHHLGIRCCRGLGVQPFVGSLRECSEPEKCRCFFFWTGREILALDIRYLPSGKLTSLLKMAICSWFTHKKLWFSTVMSVYQRVWKLWVDYGCRLKLPESNSFQLEARKSRGHGRDAPGAHAAQRQLQSIWEIHRAAVWIPSRVDLSHVTCGFFFVLIWSWPNKPANVGKTMSS